MKDIYLQESKQEIKKIKKNSKNIKREINFLIYTSIKHISRGRAVGSSQGS